MPGAADDIVATLDAYGFRADGPIVFQSRHDERYRAAFERLHARDLVYPCGCTRREIEDAAAGTDDADAEPRYPGTCRDGLAPGRSPRAWRLRVPDRAVVFHDRAAGTVSRDVARDVGDFVVRRADGIWAYQLAVVVDDADAGVTDVVRGADLLDSTARQRIVQEALGLPTPRTLHVPLVLASDGSKLAKRHGASALPKDDPLPSLHAAARHLALEVEPATTKSEFWERATAAWAARWR